jgi:hypothetical protein
LVSLPSHFRNLYLQSDPHRNSKLRRGPSDFNIKHNLVLNYTWALRAPHLLGEAGALVLGGWQVGGIFQATTGLRFTPVLGGDPLGLNSNDPRDYPDHLSTPGCRSGVNSGNVNNYIKLECFAFPNPSTRLGNTGRNSLTGPGLSNFDLSLFKNNYIKRISENFNAQFRMEFFNILNHSNFQAPIANSTLFDQGGSPVAGAGALNATSTLSREIQFALKIMFWSVSAVAVAGSRIAPTCIGEDSRRPNSLEISQRVSLAVPSSKSFGDGHTCPSCKNNSPFSTFPIGLGQNSSILASYHKDAFTKRSVLVSALLKLKRHAGHDLLVRTRGLRTSAAATSTAFASRNFGIFMCAGSFCGWLPHVL